MSDKNIISFFNSLTRVTPTVAVSLAFIYNLIKGDTLKDLTLKIRQDISLKKKLACVTFAGEFFRRCKDGLKEWASLVAIDIDHLDFTPALKERLSKDCFLNPVLVYVTPSGEGLRLVVRVKGGTADKYGLYYELISFYLQGAYGIPVDGACSDVSRLSFICWDPEVYFFEDGFVSEESLLRLQPKTEERQETEKMTKETPPGVSFVFVDALRERRKSAVRNLPPAYSPSDPKPSELLNRIPAVHALAEDALRRHGWKQKGELWTRAGKELREGSSAKYNLYPAEGIHIMTNFSSNARPFLKNKGYSDVQIISELDYNGDFKQCIGDLAHKYLNSN